MRQRAGASASQAAGSAGYLHVATLLLLSINASAFLEIGPNGANTDIPGSTIKLPGHGQPMQIQNEQEGNADFDNGYQKVIAGPVLDGPGVAGFMPPTPDVDETEDSYDLSKRQDIPNSQYENQVDMMDTIPVIPDLVSKRQDLGLISNLAIDEEANQLTKLSEWMDQDDRLVKSKLESGDGVQAKKADKKHSLFGLENLDLGTGMASVPGEEMAARSQKKTQIDHKLSKLGFDTTENAERRGEVKKNEKKRDSQNFPCIIANTTIYRF